MKSASLALIAGVFILTTPAAAAESRSYDLSEFDRIDVSAGVVLIAKIGDAQSIHVETEHGDFRDFTIDVKNQKLNVSREWNRLSWHSKKSDYKVFVSVPKLNAIGVSSGSHAKISNIDTRKFVVDLSSGARANLAGNCRECVLDLSSGANLDAKALTCENANIDVSSGGRGVISVSHSIVADASSGGHVTILGNPERVNIDKSSGGRIKIISKPQMSQN